MRKFHFPTDFVVVDFEADPRVPLILGRSFLRTVRALINVYGEEITLRVNDEVVTFNLNQTTRYSSRYDDLGNPTSTSEPILSDSSLSLTPFEGSDFLLEEIEAYIKDESNSPKINHADCDPEGDICVDKLPVIIAKDLKVDEKDALLKVLKSHKRAIAWEIIDIKDFSKIARPMTHLLEKETLFVFSKDCIDAFETLKKKLTETSILLVLDWNLPFELMCDSSDFAIGAVLGAT
nr:reverse transcriptase domain-containing protein [Tanacetum cinerariifolium]